MAGVISQIFGKSAPNFLSFKIRKKFPASPPTAQPHETRETAPLSIKEQNNQTFDVFSETPAFKNMLRNLDLNYNQNTGKILKKSTMNQLQVRNANNIWIPNNRNRSLKGSALKYHILKNETKKVTNIKIKQEALHTYEVSWLVDDQSFNSELRLVETGINYNTPLPNINEGDPEKTNKLTALGNPPISSHELTAPKPIRERKTVTINKAEIEDQIANDDMLNNSGTTTVYRHLVKNHNGTYSRVRSNSPQPNRPRQNRIIKPTNRIQPMGQVQTNGSININTSNTNINTHTSGNTYRIDGSSGSYDYSD